MTFVIVCDLPGPGRPLDDEVVALRDVEHRERLRAVGVDDLVDLVRVDEPVEPVLVAEAPAGAREAVAEEGADDLVVGGLRVFGPDGRVKVVVHEQLPELEEA